MPHNALAQPNPGSSPAPVFTQHSDAPAQAVTRQFASRPTVSEVFGRMLLSSLQEYYPPLALDLQVTRLAIPNALGGWDLKRLLDVALEYVGTGKLVDVSTVIDTRRCFLTNRAPHPLTYEADGVKEPDLQIVAGKIVDLTATLSTVFQDALTDYWNQPGDTASNRWQWLGDLLASGMSSAASLLPAEYLTQQQTLYHLARHPDRRDRPVLPDTQDSVIAYCLETEIIQGSTTVNVIEPDLLVVRGQQVMLYRTDGSLTFHASMEAFSQTWGSYIEGKVQADKLVLKRYEPDGNIFDTQAALLLNRQLDALGAVELPASDGIRAVEARFAAATAPAPWFSQAPAPDPAQQVQIEPALPEWLRTAEPADRFNYRQLLLDQARVHRQTGGTGFLDGIENLHVFTTRTLQEQMREDHPDASAPEPDDLDLTFQVPVGDLGSGYLHPVRMTLTELAVRNLAAAPQGKLTIRSTSGAVLPTWMTADYVLGEKGLLTSTLGLIARANIGERYPNAIKALLLSNDSESERRERLFAQELCVRLPLQALEHKIRAESGFSALGYRYVHAVLQRNAPERVVDGLDIVIRALAFLRTPHASPDVVSNMFIIEAAGNQGGPHILYRPLYKEVLREFATRAELLQAIAQAGPLQDSVLSWLPDRSRPVYSNGGFASPHILRFGQGDDTVQWEAPAPAQLAIDANGDQVLGSLGQSLAAGRLTQFLYGSNARALIDLAERDTVSNAESRWAILLEGGWLMFNALLLPLLRGPAMAIGWMVQLAASLRHDLDALHSDDPSERELAWVDVLLNIGLLLLHSASAERVPHVHSQPALPVALRTLRPPISPRTGPAATVEQGTISLPATPPANDRTLVDFIHSTARDSSRRRLLYALLELNVAWPDPVPTPIELGPHKGLYRIGNQLHAAVAGMLFEVTLVGQTGDVFILHPQKPQHPGFLLKVDAKGRWSLDLGLKLRGGGPKVRAKSRLAEIEQKRRETLAVVSQIRAKINELAGTASRFFDVVNNAKRLFDAQDSELTMAMDRLSSAPNDPVAQRDHASKAQHRARARLNLIAAYENYSPANDPLMQAHRELIEQYAQVKAADGRFDYEANCLKEYHAMLATEEVHIHFQATLHHAALVSDQGESLLDLGARTSDPLAYERFIDLTKAFFDSSEHYGQAIIRLDAILEEMAVRLKIGAAERIKFLNAKPDRRRYNRVSVIVEPLYLLNDLSIDESREVTTAQDQYFLSRIKQVHLSQTAVETSYVDLLTTQGFTPDERRAVLTNVISHYTARLQTYRSMVELDSPLLRGQYMTLLIERLSVLLSGAEVELADVLREDEFLPAHIGRFKAVQFPSTTKRVFRTRDNGTLVGELQPADADTPFPTMVVKNPLTEQVDARFMEHPEEGWVGIVDAPPQPVVPAPPPQRALATLRAQAQRLIEQIPPLEKSIAFQKRKLADPQRRNDVNPRDWSDMLDYHATRIEAVTTEMRTLYHDSPGVAKTLERLQQQAKDLRLRGVQHCIQGFKAQPPRQTRIDYLRSHQAVDIGLVHGPQRTAAKDYVSEFAVREPNSTTVLWYAHFHYSQADQRPGDYTVAHLKRPEHRFKTLKDLIVEAGADSHTLINDLYSPISPPLDQRLFLALLPD